MPPLNAMPAVAGSPAWSGILAHEKWFHHGPTLPAVLRDALSPGSLTAAGVAVAIAAVAGIVWWLVGKRDPIPGPDRCGASPERRAIFYGIVPLWIAVHLAVPLLTNALHGSLLSPNNKLQAPWTYFLGVAQIGVALALFYGAMTRVAAGVLAALWVVGLPLLGVEAMADNIHAIGFALFFLLVGRGPVAVDRLLFPNLEPRGELIDRAMTVLRVFLGLTLIVLAYTEKLGNLALAESFLKQYPVNFMTYYGSSMTDRTFALCGGCVELMVGLLLVFGIFPRVTILVAWLPFNMTLMVFSWSELVGHLPFYGSLALLLIWTPGEEDRKLFRQGIRGGRLALGGETASTL